MATYSIQDHRLEYSANFSALNVTDLDGVLVEGFSTSTAREVKCEGGNYVITATSMPSGGYSIDLDPDNGDTATVNQTDQIGISDLRTERVMQYTHHLDVAPITVQLLDGKLKVQGPGDASGFDSECCTVVEL